MVITVDCGTTNMRCRLFGSLFGEVLYETRRKAGVRNTAFTGTADFLRVSLKESIEEILTENGLSSSDIEVVLSSGTLASDVGIYLVPHILLPAGVKESAAAARLVVIPEITEIPILFIPGVKTLPVGTEESEDEIITLLESMSGEECEIYGIMELLHISEDFQIVLPGSYNKTMDVDADGRIRSILTGMCGEFLAANSEHTLLKHSLPSPLIREPNAEKLILGYRYAEAHGTSPALIKARMVRVHRGWSADEAANFFVGAALCDDIRMTRNAYRAGKKLYVGGGQPLRGIFMLLLKEAGVPAKALVEVPDDIARIAPAIGAMKVYQAKC